MKNFISVLIILAKKAFAMNNKKIMMLAVALSCFCLPVQGMGFYASYKEYKRSYDIDYEDKSETLEGIDANKNGMRDDLEKFGKEALKDWDPLVLKAYHNWLKNLYVVMKNNAEINNDTKINYMNTHACFEQLVDDEYITNEEVREKLKDVDAQIFNLAFNTEKRKEIMDDNWYLIKTYLSAESIVNLKYSCVDLKLPEQQLFLLQKRSITYENGKLEERKNLSRRRFKEKPVLYENNVEFDYYKNNIKTIGEVYEEFYKRLDDSNK